MLYDHYHPQNVLSFAESIEAAVHSLRCDMLYEAIQTLDKPYKAHSRR